VVDVSSQELRYMKGWLTNWKAPGTMTERI